MDTNEFKLLCGTLIELWNDARKQIQEIGIRIAEAKKKATAQQIDDLYRILRDRGLATATLKCWVRVAQGTLPEAIMATEIRHSTIEHMTNEYATKLVSGESVTYNYGGQIRTKSVLEMTREEASAVVGTHNLRTQAKPESEPVYRHVRASKAWIDEKNRVCVELPEARCVGFCSLGMMQDALSGGDRAEAV